MDEEKNLLDGKELDEKQLDRVSGGAYYSYIDKSTLDKFKERYPELK